MKNIIIGTAGHVDHGKTCLIKALSGIDTDRLKEEKKRGITIENGFANLPNDKGYHIGIIDVPGHEKFIKNMLKGIGGIDIALLVISLDEGIKPQTVEHFEIIKSLGIQKGIIVFTKLDSEKKLDFDILQKDVSKLVENSFLQNAEMICVSAMDGTNIDVLKNKILNLIESIPEKVADKNNTRLPIDRVFTMEGFGTVITGTLFEGQINVGDELMLYPEEKIVKVRQIESHGKIEQTAYKGQRTAVNLLNVKKEDINRGDILATKGSIIMSDIIDASLTLFNTRSRDIKNGEKLYFNFGASQKEASVRIIKTWNEGIEQKYYVQFKFNEKLPIKRTDKFIVRFMSTNDSCGGGVVLNSYAKKIKKIDDSTINYFNNIDSNDNAKILNEIIACSSDEFLDINFLSKAANISFLDAENIIKKLVAEKAIWTDNKCFVISKSYYDSIKKFIVDLLSKYHTENTIQKGIKKEELKSIFQKRYAKASDNVFTSIITSLVDEKVIKTDNEFIALSDFDVKLDNEETKIIRDIEEYYENAKYEMPLTQDVVDNFGKDKNGKIVGEKKLKARQMINDLAKSGKLVKISNDYYIHKKCFDEAVNITKKYFETNDKIEMRNLRDLLNTSRKYAILIIEYFDSKKITRHMGDYRILYK